MDSLARAITWWKNESGMSISAYLPLLGIVLLLLIMATSRKLRVHLKPPLGVFTLYLFATIALWAVTFSGFGNFFTGLIVAVLLHIMPWPVFAVVLFLFWQARGQSQQIASKK